MKTKVQTIFLLSGDLPMEELVVGIFHDQVGRLFGTMFAALDVDIAMRRCVFGAKNPDRDLVIVATLGAEIFGLESRDRLPGGFGGWWQVSWWWHCNLILVLVLLSLFRVLLIHSVSQFSTLLHKCIDALLAFETRI